MLTKMQIKWIIVVLSITVDISNGKVCPSNTSGEQLKEQLLYVQIGHYTEFPCCTETTEDIRWFKFLNSSNTWKKYEPELSDDRVAIEENGQVLVIKSSEIDDEGIYKCDVTKTESTTSTNDSKQFSLKVLECDTLARGPYPIAPLACNPTQVNLDTTVVLPCSGYFGCDDEDFRIVSWMVSRQIDGKTKWETASEVSERYNETQFTSEGNSVVGSNLTISGVTGDDLNRKFRCSLITAQMIKGQTNIVVELAANSKDSDLKLQVDTSSISFLMIVCSMALLSLAIIIATVAMVIHHAKRSKYKVVSNSFQHVYPSKAGFRSKSTDMENV